jgi:hypothetical protein
LFSHITVILISTLDSGGTNQQTQPEKQGKKADFYIAVPPSETDEFPFDGYDMGEGLAKDPSAHNAVDKSVLSPTLFSNLSHRELHAHDHDILHAFLTRGKQQKWIIWQRLKPKPPAARQIGDSVPSTSPAPALNQSFDSFKSFGSPTPSASPSTPLCHGLSRLSQPFSSTAKAVQSALSPSPAASTGRIGDADPSVGFNTFGLPLRVARIQAEENLEAVAKILYPRRFN